MGKPAMKAPASGAVCVDGVVTSPGEARIAALDHGVLFGDGVFETLRTYAGVPFLLPAHLERLARTTFALGISNVPPTATIAGWVQETLGQAGLEDAAVRITVTRGRGERGWDPEGCETASVIVSALPLRLPPPHVYAQGVAVLLHGTRTDDALSAAVWKTTSYQGAILARKHANTHGAYEALIQDGRGHVLEATMANVFAVVDGALLTPAEGCLPGITRAEVLRIARERDMNVAEEALSSSRLRAADELFLTSSIAELVPVVRVGGQVIADGSPGPTTRGLLEAYRARTLRTLPR